MRITDERNDTIITQSSIAEVRITETCDRDTWIWMHTRSGFSVLIDKAEFKQISERVNKE